MSVSEQHQYDAPLVGWHARQGQERQPSVAARTIWEALHIVKFWYVLSVVHHFVVILYDLYFDVIGHIYSNQMSLRHKVMTARERTKISLYIQ